MPPTPSFMKTVKEASAVCRSFLDCVVIFSSYKGGCQYLGGKKGCPKLTEWSFFIMTSVSARWCVPYAVEENFRGMTERKKEWQSLGLFKIRYLWLNESYKNGSFMVGKRGSSCLFLIEKIFSAITGCQDMVKKFWHAIVKQFVSEKMKY